MFKKQNEESLKKVETIIGPSVKVKGDFNSNGNIIVEGTINGSLKTKGNLLVGNKAKITANVTAKEAKIGGEIKGSITVQGYLELRATAKIFGDISASELSVEKGAILNGKCAMLPETQSIEINSKSKAPNAK